MSRFSFLCIVHIIEKKKRRKNRIQWVELRSCWLFIFILLFILKGNIKAQDTPVLDSYSEELEEFSFDSLRALYKMYFLNNPDSSIILARIHLRKAQANKNILEEIRALNNNAIYYSQSSQHETAKNLILKAIDLEKQIDTKDGKQTFSYFNAANIYERIDPKISFRYYHKALDELKIRKNTSAMWTIYNNLGLLYYSVESYDKALDYFEKAKMAYESKPNIPVDPYILLNLGKS